ncbi:MAG: hypothetical protein GXO42_02800 [bacterium]|nr:hypothetical protein [bacterium]
MTDLPMQDPLELAAEVLVDELGLASASSGEAREPLTIYIYIYDNINVIIILSNVLRRLILFADPESLCSAELPSELLTELAKVLASSRLLRQKVELRGLVGNNTLYLGGKFFRFGQQLDEAARELAIRELRELMSGSCAEQ